MIGVDLRFREGERPRVIVGGVDITAACQRVEFLAEPGNVRVTLHCHVERLTVEAQGVVKFALTERTQAREVS